MHFPLQRPNPPTMFTPFCPFALPPSEDSLHAAAESTAILWHDVCGEKHFFIKLVFEKIKTLNLCDLHTFVVHQYK
jgi:hypothetical protein